MEQAITLTTKYIIIVPRSCPVECDIDARDGDNQKRPVKPLIRFYNYISSWCKSRNACNRNDDCDVQVQVQLQSVDVGKNMPKDKSTVCCKYTEEKTEKYDDVLYFLKETPFLEFEEKS